MRTDVKIGIAVVLVLALVIVCYYVLFAGGDSPPTSIQTPTVPAEPGGIIAQDTLGMDGGIDDLGDIPGDDEADEDEADMPPVSEPLTPRTDSTERDDATATLTPRVATPPDAEEATDEDDGEPVADLDADFDEDDEDEAYPREISPSADDDNGRLGTEAVAVTPRSLGARTHKIQEGETLEIIAQKEWGPGNGRYWKKIRDANPGLSPTNLRIGKMIEIPALTTTERTPTGSYTAAVAGSPGTRTYVVKDGDTLWEIADRADVYGNGSKYTEIIKANPGVNSRTLRVGQKLSIPPLAAVTRSTAVGGSVVMVSGKKYYIVKSGDSLWKIAARELGNGVYHKAIANLNKSIDPSNLKVGQKLLMPTREEASKMMPATVRSPGRSRPAADTSDSVVESADDEPVFD